ncbi:MAG TPA: SDR family NAD(P)-dependent oxidoreductase, partial [Steroidobacteraceae bacterium]|nr:SDR family NAD(P)-dependent oxidoreductase [Steroidobacteraceae bacterium]
MSATAFSLAGRVALVTGANAGIGQGIAVALAAAGADVAAVGRSEPGETGERVRAAGRRFIAIQADLDAAQRPQEIVQEVTGKLGPLDILVNNA